MKYFIFTILFVLIFQFSANSHFSEGFVGAEYHFQLESMEESLFAGKFGQLEKDYVASSNYASKAINETIYSNIFNSIFKAPSMVFHQNQTYIMSYYSNITFNLNLNVKKNIRYQKTPTLYANSHFPNKKLDRFKVKDSNSNNTHTDLPNYEYLGASDYFNVNINNPHIHHNSSFSNGLDRIINSFKAMNRRQQIVYAICVVAGASLGAWIEHSNDGDILLGAILGGASLGTGLAIITSLLWDI